MTYSAEVLADSPYLYWRLGDASGTTATDSSGNARHGTYNNSPTLGVASLLTSDADTAVTFDGANDSATIADTANLTAFTAEAWFKLSSTSAGTMLGRDAITSSQNIFRIEVTGGASSAIQAIVWKNSSTLAAVTGPSVRDSTRHHVVLTYDGTTTKLYLDGASVGTPSTTVSGALPTADTAFSVGSGQNGANNFFTGTVDEVAYYTTALSSTRVGVHYAAGIAAGGVSIGGTVVVPTPTVAGGLSLGAAPSSMGGMVVVPMPVVAGGLALGGGPVDIGGDIIVPMPVVAGSLDTATSGTDVTNRHNGISLRGIGTLVWEPDVQPPPAGAVQGQAVVKAQSHTASVDPDTGEVTLAATIASKPASRTRITIGGYDITYWRGIPTPEPDYTLAKPLGYGPATISLPQAKVPLETPGVGELAFCAKGKNARIQRVDPETNETIATDWIGFVVAYNMDGGTLTLELGGHGQGRAALVELQPPIFPGRSLDVGRHMYNVLNQGLGLNMSPFHGPTTGMETRRIPGMGGLEAVSTLCAMAQGVDGTQWTVLPNEGTTLYRMLEVDTETIHGTVWLDDAHTPASLRSDMAEEPNRIYARGVTPNGLRVRFGAYPFLAQGETPDYPMNDNSAFGVGTVDADTDSGDGVTVMNLRLSGAGYRTPDADNTGANQGIFTADDAESIRQLQRDTDLTVSGNMTVATWNRLWDVDATGYSIARSRVLPAAQTDETKPFIRSSSGAPIARNPAYDKRVVKVDRTIDIEGRFNRRQIKRFANHELDNGSPNWLGTITFNLGGLAEGDIAGPVADVMDARDLRPGMNLKVANLDDAVVYVSGIQYGSGTVTATVDTRARDGLEAWQVIQRNRESRRNPARAWLREHRGRSVTPRTFDEFAGLLDRKWALPGYQWTVIPVVAGIQGTVNLLRVDLTGAPAEFCIAVFGRRIGPKKLAWAIGNPLTEEGSERWQDENLRDKLDHDNLLLYAAGDFEQPCGHWPGRDQTGEDVPNGRWQDDASFGYRTSLDDPRLWVAIYPDRDTHLQAGRIMWPQLEEGA